MTTPSKPPIVPPKPALEGIEQKWDTAWESSGVYHFDRTAPSLEFAIQSAVAQVRAAGFAVTKVELDAAATACLEATT